MRNIGVASAESLFWLFLSFSSEVEEVVGGGGGGGGGREGDIRDQMVVPFPSSSGFLKYGNCRLPFTAGRAGDISGQDTVTWPAIESILSLTKPGDPDLTYPTGMGLGWAASQSSGQCDSCQCAVLGYGSKKSSLRRTYYILPCETFLGWPPLVRRLPRVSPGL